MKQTTKKIFSVFIYSIIFIFAQMPCFLAEGQYYTIYGLYSYAEKTGTSAVIGIQIIILILYQVMGLLHLLVVLLNKRLHLNYGSMVLCIVNMFVGMGNIAENGFAALYPGILVILSAAELLIPKMADAMKEAEGAARESQLRYKQDKEEEKRRLRFDGTYPELFYRIIWKNFFYHWRDYALFVLCGAMVSTLSFIGLGSYEMMVKLHGTEGYIIGAGLGTILMNALLPIGACAAILMVYVLVFYLKKRMLSYSMFLIMGSRKKTLYIMMALEIVFSLLCALIIGCLSGNGILLLLRRGIVNFLGADVILSPVTWVTYLKMFGVTVLIYLISLVGFRDIAQDLNIISASAKRVRGERIPRKALKPLTIVGGLIVLWSIFSYWQLKNYEDIKLLGVHFVGIFLIIRYGMASYLRKAQKGKNYLPCLMNRNYLYHKSKTTTWYLCALALISTCAVFYFTFQTVPVTMVEETDTLFPYDYMCIADEEDDSFFENLQDEYDLELTSFPMVRVSSGDGRAGIEAPGEHSPQGQHIGISETTYHALKKALDTEYQSQSLGLDDNGKKIYVVHQQDRSIRAQPTEWQFNRSKPRLHIGLPCISYTKAEPAWLTGYWAREIVGEKIESLTGCFRQGLQENLIVFSDEYFETAQREWEYTDIRTGRKIESEEARIQDLTIRQGPTKLVLINAQESDLDSLEAEMKTLEQMPNHVYEANYNQEVSSYYSKKAAINDLETERVMRLIVNSSVIVTLMITYIFFIFVKAYSEMDDKIKRATFLKIMGMYRKERVCMLKKELYPFFWIPAIITIAATIYFTAATFHARMYTVSVMREYLERAVWIWGICLIIEGAAVSILSALVIHKVEGKDE